MIPQNQHSNRHSQAQARLLYTAPSNSLENDNQLLQLYLKDLTFQGSVDGPQELSNEEVQEFKRIFSLLFDKYQMGLLSLTEIQGLWPFMHFAFPNISGIQLYLYFEYLLTPAPFQPAKSAEIKEEYVSFNPQKYFQESKWKDHKKFMRCIRVLERTLKKKSIDDNLEACQSALSLVVLNGQQFLIAAKQFKTKFNIFQEKQKGVSVATVMNLDQLFNERLYEDKCIESQPDFIHTIHAFTKEEYFQRHNTKTKTMIEMAPIKEEQQAENPAQHNGEEYYEDTISARGNARNTQNEMRSLPTKRRLETEKTTLRRREIKRTPRKKAIQALFKKREKQNIIVKDLILNRKGKERKVKEARRLEKIKKRICYSDDEDQNTSKRKKRAKRLSNPKIQIQSEYESRYSHSNHKEQEYFSDDSEEIQIKRNRNIYRKQVVLNEIQNNFDYSNRNGWKRQSEDQMMVIEETLIQTKLDKYVIGKMKASQPRVVRSQEKFDNIQIRKIRFAEEGNLPISFNFAQYMRYLQALNGNEVEKEVKKIAKEVVVRLDIQYDVNLALKIMAAWVVGKRNASTNWINAVNNYIQPLLKFTIGVNFYRTISNLLNDFFAYNDDLIALNTAKMYFNLLFQVGKSYASKGLQVIIMEIIYNFMITPKKYSTVALLQYFYPQCSAVFLSHPFKIAENDLKMSLVPTEASIAFSLGSLAFQALFIWNIADHSDVFKAKQKTYFDNFKNDLNGLDHNWPFHTFSKVLKNFYTTYQPHLTFDYFKRLICIISFSLQKIILSSLAQTNIDPKEHVDFLLEVIDKFIQTQLIQATIPPVKNLLSKLIMQTNLKQTFGNQKGNKYRIMLYASVLDLIISKPFFRRNYTQVRGDFIKYVNQLKSQLSQIVSSLKSNIYQPIFSLISQIYEIEIDKQLKMGNDADKKYEEIRSVIGCLWECLDKEYSKQSQRLNDHLNPRVPSKLSENQKSIETKKIKDQFKKCQDIFQLFLTYFIPINDQSSLSPSTSHYSFVLEFILKQQFFIKYFQNKICNNGQGNLSQKFVEILNTYLHTSIHNQKKHLQIISANPNAMKKEIQHKILRETSDQTILDVFSIINWTYMIAAIEKFKTQQTSPPQNTILRMVSDSVGQITTNYCNLAKAVNLYNLYLRKLRIYMSEREESVMKNQMQEPELVKMKSFVWNHLTGNGKLKDIVLLVVLSSATRNCIEYESIPWSDLLYSIKKLNLINEKNLKTNKDIGYLTFLYNLQRLENYNSIAGIFSKILHFRNTLNKEDSLSLTKGIETMLMDVFAILKKLQQTEREKEPITLLCLQILSFLLQWPQILPQCINKFWKDMQVISKGECMIAKLRMNDRNVEILLRFFYLLDCRKENPYQIKDTMGIFAQKMSAFDNIRKEQYFKRIKKMLISIRQCCKKDNTLQRIAYPFLKDFLNRFCSPQKLQGEHYSTWVQRLQIYLEMMRDSVYERKAYEQLLINNRKKYQEMIVKYKGFKVQYHTQQQQYYTLQLLILTCMINRHSDFYDIKRLLGAMKKQALLKAQIKQVYRALFGKLKTYAEEMIKQDIVEWSKDQLKDLQQMGNIQDWMDLQSD